MKPLFLTQCGVYLSKCNVNEDNQIDQESKSIRVWDEIENDSLGREGECYLSVWTVQLDI